MTDKQKKIREVMRLLKQNKIIKIGCGELWHGYCHKAGRELIYWRHYGQSANKCNLKELTWIINTIFGYKRKDFSFSVK